MLEFLTYQLPGIGIGMLATAAVVLAFEWRDHRRSRPKPPARHIDISPAIARARRAAKRKR
jgi:hypothetical protein